MAANQFGVVDYVVFVAMLLVSAVIGIYHACRGGKQKTTREYLFADKNMLTWPIAFSLVASYLSAITLLGVPAEVYTFGLQYIVLVLFSYVILMSVVNVLFVPMFHRVKISSSNEYLEMRFSPGVRSLACILHCILTLCYLSLVMYVPSLAMEVVAGIPLAASIVTTAVVCTFYTSLGGLKAVVWTEVFQAIVMFAGLVTVCIVGTQSVGGFQNVIDINRDMDRLNIFDFNPDPTVRNTFWTLSIGGAFAAMPAWTVTQAAVQRFLAVKSVRLARRAVWINLPGLLIITSLCCLDGLVIYAVYAKCDVRLEGKIHSNDQILPFFVSDKLGHLTGVKGLFTACIFAGALSTASSSMSALSLIILEDVVKKRFPDLTDFEASKICKMIAVVLGGIVIGGTFVVQHCGAMVLQLAYSVGGIIGGPLVGMFSLGMLISRANSKGVYAGVLCGAATTLWLFIGAQVYPPYKYPAPVSLQQCPAETLNETTARLTNDSILYFEGDGEDPSSPSLIPVRLHSSSTSFTRFYSMSYLWYSAIGISVTMLLGTLTSFLFENENDRRHSVDSKLIFPLKAWLQSFMPGKWHTWNPNTGLPISEDGEDWEEDWVHLGENGRRSTEHLERTANNKSNAQGQTRQTSTI